MYRKPILIGEKFGERTVILETDERKNGYVLYLVECRCGELSKVSGSYLRKYPDKLCRKCTCKKVAKTGKSNHFYRHGQSQRSMGKTSVYNSWISMRSRCNNKNDDQYKDYGGRGIKVCDRWSDFSLFYEDMGDRPEQFQLDRIDNDGSYCKENCRWAHILTQANNRRTTTYFLIDGNKIPRADLERTLGISRERFRRRLESYAIKILQDSNKNWEEINDIFIT